MTTNKPEVVAWGVPNSRLTERQPFMQLLHTQEGTQYPELLVPLIRLSDYEALQAELERERQRRFDGNEQSSREHREEIAVLVEALESLIKGYVSLLEAGMDRITSLGGDCDPVPVMEQNDPWLRAARAALAPYRKGGEA